jgi:hypothetical protein
MAYGILVRADRSRYGKLIEEIENDYLKGNNDYPETPTEAYNLLVNYRSYNNNKRPAGQGGGLDHVAFLTEEKNTNMRLMRLGISHTLSASSVTRWVITRAIAPY